MSNARHHKAPGRSDRDLPGRVVGDPASSSWPPAGDRAVLLGPRRLSAVRSAIALGAVACLISAGCGDPQPRFNAQDQYGRTYYIDGAGNWGYGVSEVRDGLRQAGYRGNIVIYGWSPTFNPALDQTVGRPIARAKGEQLGRQITRYCERFTDNQVNVIALSAGTGVAVWACENVEPPARVHNLILLGSSLSATYDMRKALANIEGKVYVYHSRQDMVLQGPVRTLGTIDGKLAVDAAGLVGLLPPAGGSGKIENIPWSRKYERYGWTGAHTDATSVPFVRTHLARHIIRNSNAGGQEGRCIRSFLAVRRRSALGNL